MKNPFKVITGLSWEKDKYSPNRYHFKISVIDSTGASVKRFVRFMDKVRAFNEKRGK